VTSHVEISRHHAARAQLNYFIENISSTRFMVPLVVGGVAAIFVLWSGLVGPTIWAIATVSGYFLFYYVCTRMQPDDTRPQAFTRWARSVVWLNALSEAIWVSMLLWFWVPGDILNNAVILGVISASLPTAIGNSAIYLPLLYGAVFVPTIGLVARCVTTNDPVLIAVSVIVAVYALFLLAMGKSINRTTTAMLVLRDEKDALIERLEAEKSVAERERAKSERANQTKSVFLASVSHELRTPLNAIIGFSDMMRDEVFGPLGDEKYRQYSSDIHGSGHYLLSLINDILDLARIEAGRVELEEAPLALNEVALDAARMIDVAATSRDIQITDDLANTLPRVRADERAIRQLWLNLASNAIKFTDAGGRITLFTGVEPDGSIAFGVEDNGCGMDEDECSKVMEIFAQGYARSRTSDQGTGLGLAIVDGLVRAHGGDFALSSAVGVGTRATVRLPADRVIANYAPDIRQTA